MSDRTWSLTAGPEPNQSLDKILAKVLPCNNFGSVFKVQPGSYGFVTPFQLPSTSTGSWVTQPPVGSRSAWKGKIAPAAYCSPNSYLNSFFIASLRRFLTAEYIMLDLNFRWLQGGHEINTKCICMSLFTVRRKVIWIQGFKAWNFLNKDMVRESLEQRTAKYKHHTQPNSKGNVLRNPFKTIQYYGN